MVYCRVMQRVAVWCSASQCVAVRGAYVCSCLLPFRHSVTVSRREVILPQSVLHESLFFRNYLWFLDKLCDQVHTRWWNPIGCIIFIGYYPQKSHIICGSFAENDLQLKAYYGSSPPCKIIFIMLQRRKERRNGGLTYWLCVAVCCSALQCVAVWCRVEQYGAVCCSVVQCVAVWCSVVQRGVVCCSVLQCVAVCCSAL